MGICEFFSNHMNLSYIDKKSSRSLSQFLQQTLRHPILQHTNHGHKIKAFIILIIVTLHKK